MICREKVSCMGVNCEEVLMLSFLPRRCHPDTWIKAFVAELQDGGQQMSCVPSASRYNTRFLFSSFCHFSFHLPRDLPQPRFQFITICKKVSELDIVRADLLWFIVSDLFVSRAAIA